MEYHISRFFIMAKVIKMKAVIKAYLTNGFHISNNVRLSLAKRYCMCYVLQSDLISNGR